MTPQTAGGVCVGDMTEIMERFAPPHLAEEWDNCGLQVGSLNWPARRVWVALDPLPTVVQAAVEANVDLLITHHPLLLRPLRSIDVETPTGGIIAAALKNGMAIYCAHTNLDSSRQGINDILADVVGIVHHVPLVPAPVAGQIESAAGLGMGRVGDLETPLALAQLAERVKRRLNLGNVRVAGDPRQSVRCAAICAGSGSGLLDAFLNTQAEVYISGDLRYHDARTLEAAGRALIDVGHFASEQIVIPPLVDRLRQAVRDAGWHVSVAPCELEHDPFYLV